MTTVFFYGLFMDEDLLTEKEFSPKNVRQACLKGFGLRIGERATLERSEEECCYGAVIQLEDHELDTLYRSDGVADYVRQAVLATGNSGESIDAVSYILPMEKISGSNSQYATALAGVARKLNLPEDYVEEIETWI